MKIDIQIPSLLQLLLPSTQPFSRYHAVTKQQTNQSGSLQKVSMVAAAVFVILGLGLLFIGKPLIGAAITLASFGIGYYFYACLIFLPGPLPRN